MSTKVLSMSIKLPPHSNNLGEMQMRGNSDECFPQWLKQHRPHLIDDTPSAPVKPGQRRFKHAPGTRYD